MPHYFIQLNNSVGQLDSTTIEVEDTNDGAAALKAAVMALAESVAYYSAGDSITIYERQS